jgi:hypothetical protein
VGSRHAPPPQIAVGEDFARSRWFGQPGLIGEDHGLDAITQPELAEDAADVSLDRRFRQTERGGNLVITQADRDRLQHLELAVGELSQSLVSSHACRGGHVLREGVQ